MDYSYYTIAPIEIDEKMGLTVTDILEAICDARALAIYKTIALAKPNSKILITKMQLTRKQ
jgi:hypothetical protein